MRFVVALTLLLFNQLAQGKILDEKSIQGEWGSGGGNALVCFIQEEIEIGGRTLNFKKWVEQNNNTIPNSLLPFIKSIEMFDLYEAKKKRGLSAKAPEIVSIEENEGFYDYLDRLGRRFIGKVDSMNQLVKKTQIMVPESSFIFHEAAIKYQNDLGTVTLPQDHCVISTMAGQVSINGYFEVHIDERLFNHSKHSKQSKATLVLHELIYAYARFFNNEEESSSTRKMVSAFISYSSGVTEGSVSKLGYNLGFFKSEFTGNGVPYAFYQNSKTMEIFSNFSKEYLNEFLKFMDKAYKDEAIVQLISEYKQLLSGEGYEYSGANINQFINAVKGMKERFDNPKWNNFYQKALYIIRGNTEIPIKYFNDNLKHSFLWNYQDAVQREGAFDRSLEMTKYFEFIMTEIEKSIFSHDVNFNLLYSLINENQDYYFYPFIYQIFDIDSNNGLENLTLKNQIPK